MAAGLSPKRIYAIRRRMLIRAERLLDAQGFHTTRYGARFVVAFGASVYGTVSTRVLHASNGEVAILYSGAAALLAAL